MGLRDGESSKGLVEVVMVGKNSPQQCCPPKELGKQPNKTPPGFSIINFSTPDIHSGLITKESVLQK